MKIIAIEGPDGVGKSTQVNILKNQLKEKGYKVYSEHFPRYETSIGKLIKNILDGKEEMPSFDAMQMLYVADQVDFRNKIREIEKCYDYIILDRYFLSTIVYYCTKLNDFTLLSVVRGWQTNISMPDITLILESETTITEKDRYKELDVLEQDVNLMSNINNGYMYVHDCLKPIYSMKVIQANDTIDNVSKKIQEVLKENFII